MLFLSAPDISRWHLDSLCIGDARPLEVPDAIDAAFAQKLKSRVREMVKGDIQEFYPQVVVSYASGQRPKVDEQGTGPGFVQAFQFITLLQQNGHLCFSGLHVPADGNWKIFFLRLDGEKAKAKVFIALLNQAYFKSLPCMNELHRAINAKLKIVLVRTEENTPPPKEDQWKEDIWKGKMTADAELERMDVRDFVGKKNVMPHPGTLLTVPETFDEILKIIREHCTCDAPTNNERGSSSEQVATSAQVETSAQVTALVMKAERERKAHSASNARP
jgi:hypothetical protein